MGRPVSWRICGVGGRGGEGGGRGGACSVDAKHGIPWSGLQIGRVVRGGGGAPFCHGHPAAKRPKQEDTASITT
jgi:hypothetical protein